MNKKFVNFLCLMALPFLMVKCEKASDEDEGGHNYSHVTDSEGNTYRTITIGSQTWFADNLRTTHFRNGDAIPTTTEFPTGYAIYQWPAGGSEDSVDAYGRVYTQPVLTDDRGICPEGWHAPSDAEFQQLEAFLGDSAGAKMKEEGFRHWRTPNEGATNESGFTAVASGAFTLNGGPNSTPGAGGVGDYASYWTTTPGMGAAAWTHEMGKTYVGIYRYDSPVTLGKACRCVKDE
jgi:uncharacterized protein (TIGR02145 family)